MKFPEPHLPVSHLGEPELEFAFAQRTAHPKDGLFLYGPHQRAKKSREVRVGVVGTPEGIGHFKRWASTLMGMVEVPAPGKGEKAARLHLANFPGLEPAFGIHFDPNSCSRLWMTSRRPHELSTSMRRSTKSRRSTSTACSGTWTTTRRQSTSGSS